MTIFISFMSASVPTKYENVSDVYTKDALLCVSFHSSDTIIKFPLCNIFSVWSDYKDGGDNE